MSWSVYALLALGLASALVGGVFQSFSDFVMRGLLLAEPSGGIESMQQLNRTVYRSAFLATFLLLVPTSIGAAGYAWLRFSGTPRALVIVGALVYLLLVFAVTAAGNVPMNEHLDRLAPASAEAQAYWGIYGRTWTRWNHVRTLGSIVAAICFTLASVQVAAPPREAVQSDG